VTRKTLSSYSVVLLLMLIVLSNIANAQSSNKPSNVTLGILEDQPGEYIGKPNYRVVRAIFKRDRDGWSAFPSKAESVSELQSLREKFPKQMKWTIAFDGKSLGTISTQVQSVFHFYSNVGFEDINSESAIPTVGKRSTEYSGFLGTPVYRPLVAVSQPMFSDPGKWKPSTLKDDQLAAVREQFRVKFPKVSNCKSPNENNLRQSMYSNGDIRIRKQYSSISGEHLVEIGLNVQHCDDILDDDSPYNGHWFLIRSNGSIEYLGFGLRLVDAGDYDNDGQSEVIFQISGYNRGGYKMYYQDFQKSVAFVFGYH